MDRYEVKRELERAFAKDDTHRMESVVREADPTFVADLLQHYMEEAEDIHVYRRELEDLRTKIKELNNKSGQRVRCIKALPNRRALVQLGPIKEELVLSPNIDADKLYPGCEVLVIGSGEGRFLAEIREPGLCEGRLGKISKTISRHRVVIDDGGHELILQLAEGVECGEGDEVRYDLDSQMVVELIGNSEVSPYVLAERPTVTFDDIKGLDEEKVYLKERIIYPAIYSEKFKTYGLKPIRGALLHGPPGCGKTMVAKGIFNEMLRMKFGALNYVAGFFVVNGPEMLNKWAGNTEASIRSLFKAAREAAAKSDFPSVIFWDEIESITGRRKDTETYTPEKTVVPTLLAELQGLEDAANVILIGATNRPDLMDPAMMRPGRLGDAILEIPRPDKEAAEQILGAIFGREHKPTGLQSLLDGGLANVLAVHVYDNEAPLAYARLRTGISKPLMRQEMASGALFAQIGEEIVYRCCLAEINGTECLTIKQTIEMIDNILLTQVGVLDAGVKSGFTVDPGDYVIDVSLNA
jgi:proteasome-associated ATPase